MNALSRLRQRLAPLDAAEARLAALEGLSAGWQIAVFVLVALAVVSRNPAMFTHWQFYAEDGAVWYADAYNGGWLHSLTLPAGGYLNTLQRVGAGLSLLVPFGYAPLLMNIFGLLWQCLPVTILLSPRCRRWGSLTTRMLFAALYGAVPHAREVHVVLTNSQWHLALVLPLLLFSAAPRSRLGAALDGALFALAGFCGPYGIVLVPAGLLFWYLRRQRWTLVQCGLLAVGVAAQVLVLLHRSGSRPTAVLGATVKLFTRLFGGNIVMGSIFGAFPWAVRAPFPLLVLFALFGAAMYLYCLRHASVELRLFIAYCLLLLASALHSPLVITSAPAWPLMADVHSSRYWFFPMLALLWGSAWCFQHARARIFRFAGGAVIVCASAGIVQDWRYPRYPPLPFQQYAPAVRSRTRRHAPGFPGGSPWMGHGTDEEVAQASATRDLFISTRYTPPDRKNPTNHA